MRRAEFLQITSSIVNKFFKKIFTVGNMMKLSAKQISRHFLKIPLHYRVKFRNIEIALLILDDKALSNFYDNVVNC